MTLRCTRCRTNPLELWATVDVFSRFGDKTGVHLCMSCAVAVLSVLTPSIYKEDSMTLIYDYIRDPEDIDEAEHASVCRCLECDPDFHFERMREERMWEAS